MKLIMQVLLFALLLGAAPLLQAAEPVTSVPNVELDRYLGKWYEIGRLPMYWQRKCVSDTTAEYGKGEDGKITVTNRCLHEDHKPDIVTGSAVVVPNSGNAQLKVTFFWPISGNYWVIGLDQDYRWALVGTPNRKYLWLLSRTPVLTQADTDAALQIAHREGYDMTQWIVTPHSQP